MDVCAVKFENYRNFKGKKKRYFTKVQVHLYMRVHVHVCIC